MHDPQLNDEALAPLYADHVRTMAARFEDALAACRLDGVCIFAGPERPLPRDDSVYPFRVEPYFKAWLPLIRAVGSVLKIMPGRRPELVYRQAEDFWHEPPGDPVGFWTAHVDVQVARTDADVARCLNETGAVLGAIGDPGAFAGSFACVNDDALLHRLDFTRARKTPYEVACLEGASRIAVRGHAAAAAAFADGATEFELHQRYCTASGQRETDLPYNAIVAVDRHAAILHYQNLSRAAPERGNAFLIDAGADCKGYASDVTRTWSRRDGEFSELIERMEALQQTLCREVRSGIDFVALHRRAHELLADVLVAQGLVQCSAAEALAEGLTRIFLPHGLGHLLGLQVHDAGGWQVDADGRERPPPDEHPFLRLTRVLEPGFVVTIEPGIYFIPSLLRTMAAPNRRRVDWDAIERLLPCGGVRIEDDVLVEDSGHRNLTREAFAAAA